VPKFAGTGRRPVASSQLPLTRNNASGQPRCHRALNRSVAVCPAASVFAYKATWHELSPFHIRSLHRRCSEWLLL